MEFGWNALIAQHFWRISLHITHVRVRSEGLEPSEEPSILLPCGRRGHCGRAGAGLLHGRAFRLEVDRQIATGRGDIGMPEPPADRHQIDLRLQEVGGGGVPQDMRVEPLAGERGHAPCRDAGVLVEDVAHSVARQRLAPSIAEERLGARGRAPGLAEQGLQSLHGLGSQRAPARLAALAVVVFHIDPL